MSNPPTPISSPPHHTHSATKGDAQVTFTVDQVIPPTATQQDVYKVAAADLIDDVLMGFNATIMAYGQTGAGKTYTLSSTQPSSIGIMPRAVADIFLKASGDGAHEYIMHMSYVQIYQELIQVFWGLCVFGCAWFGVWVPGGSLVCRYMCVCCMFAVVSFCLCVCIYMCVQRHSNAYNHAHYTPHHPPLILSSHRTSCNQKIKTYPYVKPLTVVCMWRGCRQWRSPL